MPDPVRAIADAVLYEGYILWPYRRSALKNQRRFTFGGVYPPAHSAAHPDDPATIHTEVLLRGDAQIEVTVRFLHIVQRTVVGPDGEPVDELVLGGERYLTWEEAVEREIAGPGPIAVAAGHDREELGSGRAGIVRTWGALDGEVALRTERAGAGVRRVSVTVSNRTQLAGGSREVALRQTFCSTHILLRTSEGDFVSMTDPPPELADAAAACRNIGTWPVLVGEFAGANSLASSPGGELEQARYAKTVLASPIILEDHPRIAPESPGDLFDGGEIDQLLVLNILTLTDEEKAEMAASDPRAREILERTEALTPEQLMTLHGRTTLR